MKKLSLFFGAWAAFSQLANAQNNNLVVFSNDGYKFFLLVNGVQQNQTAYTNVKIQDLDYDVVKVKVVFENNSMKAIDKTIYFNHEQPDLEHVYSIKPAKKGEFKLGFLTSSPVSNSKSDPNQWSVTYGNSSTATYAGGTTVPQNSTGTGSVTNTNTNTNTNVSANAVTTTTTSTSNGSVGVNVSGGGVSGGSSVQTNGNTASTNVNAGGISGGSSVTENPNGSVNINMGMGGFGMNINITGDLNGDGIMNGDEVWGNTPATNAGSTVTTSSTTTTTTTTTVNGQTNSNAWGNNNTTVTNNGNTNSNSNTWGTPANTNTNTNTNTNNSAWGSTNTSTNNSTLATTNDCYTPMLDSDFKKLETSIKAKTFGSEQTSVFKQAIDKNCLSTAQVKSIMLILKHDDDRLKIAEMAYAKCSDKHNFYQVNDAFIFGSSMATLEKKIGKQTKGSDMTAGSASVQCYYPMSKADFDALHKSVKAKSFDDERQLIAKQAITKSCVSSEQVKNLMLLFTHDDSRLELAKTAYPYCSDKNNYYQVNDSFKFSGASEKLEKAIKEQK